MKASKCMYRSALTLGHSARVSASDWPCSSVMPLLLKLATCHELDKTSRY